MLLLLSKIHNRNWWWSWSTRLCQVAQCSSSPVAHVGWHSCQTTESVDVSSAVAAVPHHNNQLHYLPFLRSFSPLCYNFSHSLVSWRHHQNICSVLFFSHPRSEGSPHHGRNFSIYHCPLSFWPTLPPGVLSTSWWCPSRSYVVFLACVHLCDHSMLASLLWRCLTVPSLLQLLLITHSFVSLHSTKPGESVLVLSYQTHQMRLFILSESPAFTAARCYRPH